MECRSGIPNLGTQQVVIAFCLNQRALVILKEMGIASGENHYQVYF